MTTAALILTTYNRPDYLRQCLESLKRADLTGVQLIVVDDCSTDPGVMQQLAQLDCILITKQARKGICDSIIKGYEMAWRIGCDIAINLDSDAIVRNDFIKVLLKLHKDHPNSIVTGFHSLTKNRDGSERHIMTGGGDGWCRKRSVGGINILMTRDKWMEVRPIIEDCLVNGGNWDHRVSLSQDGIVCAIPSVVQHIGASSSMGHNAEQPDTAADFKPLALPNVTLVCVDDDLKRCITAIEGSRHHIDFGAICIISNKELHHSDWFIYFNKIEKLSSKEAYSAFIINDLHAYIPTSHMLIVQHDGYIKNWQAWDSAWLQYDYIGAPWWHDDGMDVGNGGFSLRSKRLMQLVSEIAPAVTHPEDEVICRKLRPELEARGMRFAPREVAEKFSFEGFNQLGKWDGQFGFHGNRAFVNVVQSKARPTMQTNRQQKPGLIINQFLGLGDILFLVPLVRKWYADGYDIIWPIADEYMGIRVNFPDIQFVAKSSFVMNYDNRRDHVMYLQWGAYTVRALRWNTYLQRDGSDCMTHKYTMYKEDWRLWRGLKWERHKEIESGLALVVGADMPEYELHCNDFGNITDGGKQSREVGESGLPVIRLQQIEGFTLLDWAMVIENATIIHAVSSSTLYLFEVLNLKAREVHLYGRQNGMKDHDYVRPIRTKKYILHE